MAIILDPSKNFVNIDLLYIEKPHYMQVGTEKILNHTTYVFIHGPEELDEWRAKGYMLKAEWQQMIAKQQPQTPPAEQTKSEPGKDGIRVAQPLPQAPPTQDGQEERLIERLSTSWKRMTWKESNLIFSHSLRPKLQPTPEEDTELDPVAYRDWKLKTCLKRWDITDADGNVLDVTPENIDALPPEVAHELLVAFEKITETTEKDLKK